MDFREQSRIHETRCSHASLTYEKMKTAYFRVSDRPSPELLPFRSCIRRSRQLRGRRRHDTACRRAHFRVAIMCVGSSTSASIPMLVHTLWRKICGSPAGFPVRHTFREPRPGSFFYAWQAYC